MFDTLESVTSQGSPHARFRRALKTGNLHIIEAASKELPIIGLDDALGILRVLAEKNDPRFRRAAARFAARVIKERSLDPAEGHRVLALAEHLADAPEAVELLLRPYCRLRFDT